MNKLLQKYGNQPLFYQFLRTMKLTIFILTVSILSSFSAETYSQTTKLTINQNNSTLLNVLKAIEGQSEFKFFYNESVEVNRTVSVEAIQKSVTDILDKVLSSTTIKYKVLGRQIALYDKKEMEPFMSEQQDKKVTGKVTDQTGASVPGASVVIKGTTTGVITDANGDYSMSNINESTTLQFSFVGMKSMELKVGNQTKINVVLAEETISLEEVIAVGYGTQKRITVTGAVSSIKSEEIKSISSANFVTGLQGKLPGLNVTQRTGEPGAFTTAYNIRGFGAPLVVVDGIIRDDFTRLDPADIDNISVLKDATAAVYGVKAANGAILITTKRGIVSKPVITYSGGYEFVKPIEMPQSNSASEFATLTTEFEINSGKAIGATTFTAQDIQKYKDGSDPLNYPSTDWMDVIAKKYSTLSTHNLSVEGGTDRIKYFTSMGYMDESGIWKSNDLNYRKFNVRSSITGKITDNLTAELNIDGILENKNDTRYPAWNVFLTALNVYPNLPVYANNNPLYLQDVTYPNNPLGDSMAEYTGYNKTRKKTFQGNFTLDYKFKGIEGLSAKFKYGFFTVDNFLKTYLKYCPEYTYDKLTNTYKVANVQNDPASLQGIYTPVETSTILGQVSYEKLFSEKHNFKTALIFEERHEKADNMNGRKEFAMDVDQFYAGVSANATVTSSGLYENRNQNVIGKLNYDYLSKYIVEAGFNYGGSSKFPSGKRWGFFPYGSVGWRLSEEKFIKDNISFVSNLKLRGSWGQMGDDGASTFQFLTGYDYPSGNYVSGGKVVGGLGFRGMPNPDITWFTVTNKNIGLDLSLFNDLISLEFDIFRRDRTGLLATRVLSLPATVGANLPQENLNADMRKGFELVMGHRSKIGELTYNISANLTYSRGQATQIERAPDGNSYLNWRNNRTDRWDNMYWGYNIIGQFQSIAEALAYPIIDNQGNRTLLPGSLKYEDVNHDGIINSLDIVPIRKGSFPETMFGLNINLAWKNIDLALFAQGATGYAFTYAGQRSRPMMYGRNGTTDFMDRWHREDLFDPNSPWVPGFWPSTSAIPTDNESNNSSFWSQDVSYLRLKNVEIGYTLDNSLLKKASIRNVRIYLSAFNVFTLTKLKFVDPEQEPNYARGWYPLSSTLKIGFNVTF